jgi:hypothetical protein
MTDKEGPKFANPSVPRFAPIGSVTLITAFDTVGKAIDPAWTGEERLAAPVVKRSTADLNDEASGIFLCEPPFGRSEDEIRETLHKRYEEETAPRCRRDAIVNQFIGFLHAGFLTAIAYGSNGKLYNIPNHIWGAQGAEEVFDTGILLISGEEVTFRRGLTQGESTAIVLINADNLQRLIDQRGFPNALAPPVVEAQDLAEWADPPGPKGGEHKPAKLAWEIAEQILSGNAKPPRGHGRLTALARRVQPELAKKGHKREIDSIAKLIRAALKLWQAKNPEK